MTDVGADPHAGGATGPAPPPAALGRAVVVGPGQAAPEAWSDAPRVVVDARTLRSPGDAVDALHAAWSRREPVVVELAVDPAELRVAERCDRPPYDLDPGFAFPRERLHFLVWANAYDARTGDLVWWHGRKAARRFGGEGVGEGGPADVRLADGTAAWVDGGPAGPPAVPGGAVIHHWAVEAGQLAVSGHGTPGGELSSDQRAAVGHQSGPARVIAPAGSGKTRVLTERLRHLLVDRSVPPGSVTVVAYNTKAAGELAQRCADIPASGGVRFRTLNSLGLAICNEFGPGGGYRVLSGEAVRQAVESVFEVRRRANADTVAPYVEALATVRLELVSPSLAQVRHPDATGIEERFGAYREFLAAAGAVDFDEQIYLALELLLTDPRARAAARRRCRYLLVDEFQDLNPAHLLLLRLLSAPAFDCFGVGDDDQVLYGYSGATPEYLVEYDRFFPGAGHHACEVNYRCPPAVVAAASNLLTWNRIRVPKTIRAAPGRPDAPGALSVLRVPGASMAARAADEVARWREEGVAPTEIAVLARVHSALLPVLVALLEAGIPCESALTTRVLGRTGARTAFAYLRMGVDPEHLRRRDLEDTVRRPSRGIAPNVVAMLTGGGVSSVGDVHRLARSLTGRDAPKVRAYAADLERMVRVCRSGTAAALRALRVDVGLGASMEVLDGSREEPDRSSHADDLLALESVAAFHPDPGTFEAWLREILDRPGPPGPAVLLSTVHRIKGREWSGVVVFGVSAGLFPHRLAQDTEGERRVLHVAITRACTQLVVLGDQDAPSPFLGELERSAPPGGPEPDNPPVPVRSRARSTGATGAGRPGDRQPPAPVEPTAAGLCLRAWRTEVARRSKMPPYVILSDRDLEGIVAAAPATLAQLARCRGIGPLKLERWGDEILAVLEAGGTVGSPDS